MTVNHNIQVAFFSWKCRCTAGKAIAGERKQFKCPKRSGVARSLKALNEDSSTQRIINLTKAPLYIDDTPSLSYSSSGLRQGAWWRTKGIKLIIIDYIADVRSPVWGCVSRKLPPYHALALKAVPRTERACGQRWWAVLQKQSGNRRCNWRPERVRAYVDRTPILSYSFTVLEYYGFRKMMPGVPWKG